MSGSTSEVNSLLVHRLSNLPSGIIAASLEFRVRVIPNGALGVSDGITLFFDDGTVAGWQDAEYSRAFGMTSSQGPGLVKPTSPWIAPCDEIVTLDLSSLPIDQMSGGGFLDVIPELNQHGFLDVVIGDETSTDYMVLTLTVSGSISYCTAGTSASACQATLSTTGVASATAASGFDVMATGVEGAKDGLFFSGTNGRQANPWGNGTSYQCVVPPVTRAGLLTGTGTTGLCDGSFSQDFNALWTAKPTKNPGAGATVQAQLWYRDPLNTSNQTTSLSDAIEFVVAP